MVKPISIRKFDGKSYHLSVTAHTKTMAIHDAKSLRKDGCARVVKFSNNYWGVYSKKR